MGEASEYENRIAKLIGSTSADDRAQGVELAISTGTPLTLLLRATEQLRRKRRAAEAKAEEAAKQGRIIPGGAAFAERMRLRALAIEATTRAEAGDEALRSYLREAQEVSRG